MASDIPPPVCIRRAILTDLDALVSADLESDAEDSVGDLIEAESWTSVERHAHRAKITAYAQDADKYSWVCIDAKTNEVVGMLLTWFRDRNTEPRNEASDFLFRYIDQSIFPRDGRFVEIFQLWVHPIYRRRGLATQMKRAAEEEGRLHHIHMICIINNLLNYVVLHWHLVCRKHRHPGRCP